MKTYNNSSLLILISINIFQYTILFFLVLESQPQYNLPALLHSQYHTIHFHQQFQKAYQRLKNQIYC